MPHIRRDQLLDIQARAQQKWEELKVFETSAPDEGMPQGLTETLVQNCLYLIHTLNKICGRSWCFSSLMSSTMLNERRDMYTILRPCL